MRLGPRALGAVLMLAALHTPPEARAICPRILAGSCWVVDGSTTRGVGSASADGQSVRCSLRCYAAGGAVLILNDDGTYSAPAPAPTITCPSGTVELPDEAGHVRERRGKLVLEPSNLAALDAAFDACGGRDSTIRRYRTTLRLGADGRTLSGISKVRIVTRARVPVTTTVKTRFTATRAITSRPAPAAAGSRTGELPICAPDLEPRCVTY
jgi:hypothetical protein